MRRSVPRRRASVPGVYTGATEQGRHGRRPPGEQRAVCMGCGDGCGGPRDSRYAWACVAVSNDIVELNGSTIHYVLASLVVQYVRLLLDQAATVWTWFYQGRRREHNRVVTTPKYGVRRLL